MSMNVNRWLKYAKAKLDDTLASGNKELDQLEARQNKARADRPWLGSDAEAPTFDETKARIAWEAEQAGPAERSTTAPDLPTDPSADDEAGERSAARLVLDQRAEESAARLAQIRAELGVDQPPPPTT